MFQRSSCGDNLGLERAIVLPDMGSFFLVQIKSIAFLCTEFLLFFLFTLSPLPFLEELSRNTLKGSELTRVEGSKRYNPGSQCFCS